jgi:pyruvate/oxaloacetate carboxyltransferase
MRYILIKVEDEEYKRLREVKEETKQHWLQVLRAGINSITANKPPV